MKTLRECLTTLRDREGSERKAALLFNVSNTAFNSWLRGDSFPTDDNAVKLAALLGLDERYVLAIVQRDRAKTEQAKKAWQRIASGFALLILAALPALTPAPADAATLHNRNYDLTVIHIARCLRRWLAAILGALAFITASAHAAPPMRLEAGYGPCRANKPPENLWHQSDLPNRIQMRDRCAEFGLAIDSRFEDVKLIGRYANLGRYAIQAQARADDNDDYTRRGLVSSDFYRAECAKDFAADCIYNWNGSGDVTGFLLGVAYEPFHFHGLHLGIEAGLFVYRATWREVITPLDCPANQCWQMQVDQRTGWERTSEVGATARAGYFYAAIRRYDVPTHAPITAGYKAPIVQIVVGVSVPL